MVFGLWRRHRARTEFLNRPKEPLDDPDSPGLSPLQLQVSPFDLQQDFNDGTQIPVGGEYLVKLSDSVCLTSYCPPVEGERLTPMQEKRQRLQATRVGAHATTSYESKYGVFWAAKPRRYLTVLCPDPATAPPPGVAMQQSGNAAPVPIPEDVVERLLQTIAQRIDRVNSDSAPPQYPT